MDKIKKLLKKLSPQERKKLKNILTRLNKGDIASFDIKKLKGRRNIFRIRKGNLRIILYKKDNSFKVLTVERRTSKTYRNN